MTVEKLMEEIVDLPLQSGVFRLSLARTDHSVGYEAHVVFRDNDHPLTGTSARGETAVEALEKLRAGLMENFAGAEFLRQENARLLEENARLLQEAEMREAEGKIIVVSDDFSEDALSLLRWVADSYDYDASVGTHAMELYNARCDAVRIL